MLTFHTQSGDSVLLSLLKRDKWLSLRGLYEKKSVFLLVWSVFPYYLLSGKRCPVEQSGDNLVKTPAAECK